MLVASWAIIAVLVKTRHLYAIFIHEHSRHLLFSKSWQPTHTTCNRFGSAGSASVPHSAQSCHVPLPPSARQGFCRGWTLRGKGELLRNALHCSPRAFSLDCGAVHRARCVSHLRTWHCTWEQGVFQTPPLSQMRVLLACVVKGLPDSWKLPSTCVYGRLPPCCLLIKAFACLAAKAAWQSCRWWQ